MKPLVHALYRGRSKREQEKKSSCDQGKRNQCKKKVQQNKEDAALKAISWGILRQLKNDDGTKKRGLQKT